MISVCSSYTTALCNPFGHQWRNPRPSNPSKTDLQSARLWRHAAIRCVVYLWPLALQWRALWKRLHSQTAWLRPLSHYSLLVQEDRGELRQGAGETRWTVWSLCKPNVHTVAGRRGSSFKGDLEMRSAVGASCRKGGCNWSGNDKRDSGVRAARKDWEPGEKLDERRRNDYDAAEFFSPCRAHSPQRSTANAWG